jgi:hypothetical protein
MTSRLSRRRLLITGGAALAGAAALGTNEASADGTEFAPIYELERVEWRYQSFLLLPTAQDLDNGPGSSILARKWTMGKLELKDGPGACAATGTLVFDKEAELQVSVTGRPGRGIVPSLFEAVAEGTTGPLAGLRYLLAGFAIRGNDGQLARVHGSVFLIAGPHDSPAFEPGGQPVTTTGTFTIVKTPV